jgi:SsrA-binding protein
MSQNPVSIKNKRARFDYELLETFEAGLVLGGTEIKSIRQSKARITESFCEFNDRGELFIVNMNIDPYSHGSFYNHQAYGRTQVTASKKGIKEAI